MNSLDQYPTPETAAVLTAIYDADGFLDQTNAPEKLVTLARKLERKLELCREAVTRVRVVALAAHDDWDESVTKRAAIKQDIEAIVNLSNQTLKATEPNP